MVLNFLVSFLTLTCASASAASAQPGKPFLIKINDQTHVIGNDIWNLTIGPSFGRKLYYKGVDLVGRAASGHYASYNGATNLVWNYTAPKIVRQTDSHTDIAFSSKEGDLHWVITPELAGAYQYFVNRALPSLGEFRTLWRLDNETFTHGWTVERDEMMPTFADEKAAKTVRDGTLERSDGTYITKYDFSTFMANVEGESLYWGMYGSVRNVTGGKGEGVGSWYIHGGKDYLNGDHLKQELMVHREGSTGDAVQLNMIHGNHYQSGGIDDFPVGKTWGPWLWYLNNGSASDAGAKAKQENIAWPYSWLQDDLGYQSRGNISGRIILSDGRPASGAAIFLGDNHPNKTTLDQGSWYYYRTYADKTGHFRIANVREGSWGLQAWPNGGSIRDVTTVFLRNDVKTTAGTEAKLGDMQWKTQGRKLVWQIGEVDRKATGFKQSGAPHEHARVTKCPVNLTYTVGKDHTGDWCFAQGDVGTWTIRFDIPSLPKSNLSSPAAVLSVSLAGYSSVQESSISVNNSTVGSLSAGRPRADSSLMRSGTVAGEWRYVEFPVRAGILREGENTVDFKITRNVQWRGYMFDSILLEWA